MTNSISLTLTHAGGIRFLSDLKKLNSTPDFREKLTKILDSRFNKSFTRCPNHVYFLVSVIIGVASLISAICLIRFVGNIGFFLLPVAVFGIISPLFYDCIKDANSSKMFYEAVAKIDSDTLGVHKMTGSFNSKVYINTVTLSTNVERLKRLKGVTNVPEKQPAPEKVTVMKQASIREIAPPQKPTPPNPSEDIPLLPKPIPPVPLNPNPQQPRSTTDSVPVMNRFSQPGMPQYPVYGPMPMNYQVQPGAFPQYTPFPGPFGMGPNQNSPFNPNVNVNQGGFGHSDLVIHEVDITKKAAQENTLKNDFYQVPVDVVDDHSDNKK